MKTSRFLRTILPLFLALVVIAASLNAGCFDPLNPGSGAALRPNTTGDLRAYFLDVGQGDASVILFRDKVILIDAGDVDRGDAVVADLQNLGVRKIDLLVATHPHADHIGGMQAVLARFPVGKVLDSGLPSSSALYEHFLGTVNEKEIPYVVARQGQTIDLDPALGILVLSPPEERIGEDLNTNSIVLRISYGTVSLLYTGDATTAAEDAMTKSGFSLNAQVLKVGHHGSSGSSSAPFLSRVDPEAAIISLESNNDYGHPHRETLDRLKAAGPLVLRTDLDGTIRVTSDGATFSVARKNDGGNIWSQAGTEPSAAGTSVSPLTPAATGSTRPSPGFTLPAVPANVTVPVPSFTLPALPVGNASDVYISAVRFNAPGDDIKNLNGEWVRLANRGNGAVLLSGWTLSDAGSGEPYRFPAFLLLPQTSVTIYTGSGEMNDTSLFMGRTSPVWGNTGDEATIRDAGGVIIDRRTEADSS